MCQKQVIIPQEKLDQASALKEEGKFYEALELYDELACVLMKAAKEYVGGLDPKNPKQIEKWVEYLKRTDQMAKIAFNVSMIFAKVGNHEVAQQYFEETILFTPDAKDEIHQRAGYKTLNI